MADDVVEKSRLQQKIFNAGHDQRFVAFADFRDDDADGETAALAQRLGHEIWFVV